MLRWVMSIQINKYWSSTFNLTVNVLVFLKQTAIFFEGIYFNYVYILLPMYVAYSTRYIGGLGYLIYIFIFGNWATEVP